MESILTQSDLDAFVSSHANQTVLIFKHSTTCPISRAAYQEVQRFETDQPNTPIAMIRVIEERPISLKFAEDVGVQHASPQAIVLDNGQAVWNASHYAITADALAKAIQGS